MSETAVATVGEIFALDLDEEVTCHLAISNSVHTMRAEQVSSSLLMDPLAKAVFEWQMEHYRSHGAPATASVLEDQFDGTNADGLPELVIVEPQTAIGDLIVRLRERYMRNEGKSAIKRLGEVAVEDPLETAREMLKEGRRLADLISKRGEIYGTGDFDRAMMEYHRQAALGAGPSIGFQEVDEHFNGMMGVTFLIAAPKTYKSWFTINAAIQNVMQGKMTYLYSLELPAFESYMRLACMAANLPYWKHLKKCLLPQDERILKQATDMIDEGGIVRIEKPAPGERDVQRMVERALNAGAEAIFIDQLQYMETRKGVNLGSANNTGDYWEVCNDLRDYSDDIPIFVVHQFNRSVMSAKEMPEAQQAKGSAAIEEVATLALGLWANKEMRRNNTVQLGTLASRNYAYESWNIEIELSRGCNFELAGPVEEDEDE